MRERDRCSRTSAIVNKTLVWNEGNVTYLFGYSYKNRGSKKLIFLIRDGAIIVTPRSGPSRGFAKSGTPSAQWTYGGHSVSFKSASITSILIITRINCYARPCNCWLSRMSDNGRRFRNGCSIARVTWYRYQWEI